MRKILGFLSCLMLLAAPALAGDTIKLGGFFDLSGRASFIGTPSKLVAEMLVEKINAEGGIGGKKIELIIADTEGDPAKAANIATKFIHKDKVVAIIGPTLTDTGMNVKKIVHSAKIPIVMTVGGDPVADLETAHFGTHLHDAAHKLVPDGHGHRNGLLGPGVPVINMNVGAADGGLADLDQNIVMADLGYRNLFHPDPDLGLGLYQRFHFFHFLLLISSEIFFSSLQNLEDGFPPSRE